MLYTEKWDDRKAETFHTLTEFRDSSCAEGKYRASEVELSAPGELSEISAAAKRPASFGMAQPWL